MVEAEQQAKQEVQQLQVNENFLAMKYVTWSYPPFLYRNA